MNIFFLGKLLVGGSTAIGVLVITLFATGHIDRWSDKGVDIYATTSSSSSTGGFPPDVKKFKCKFKDGSKDDAFDCKITKQILDDKKIKNPVSYEVFSREGSIFNSTQVDVTKEVYKITITDQYDKKSKFETDAIEIFSSSSSENIAVSEWFVYDKSAKLFKGNTKYFIGKLFDFNGTLDSKDNKCEFVDKDISEKSIANLQFNQTCTIKEFDESKTTLDESTFESTASDAKTLTQDSKTKYYLITFTDNQKIVDAGSKKIIFAKTGSDAGTSNATFTDIHSSALTKENKLLVLKI